MSRTHVKHYGKVKKVERLSPFYLFGGLLCVQEFWIEVESPQGDTTFL
jgi:hypothetical protein